MQLFGFVPHPTLPDLLVSHLCKALAVSVCMLARHSGDRPRPLLFVTVVCCCPSGIMSSVYALPACLLVLSSSGISVKK